MEEHELRASIEQVRVGTLSRRRFVQAMVGLGLTAPMAAQMLASAGVAQAQTKTTYKPTKRGGGGALRVLWWQGATLLNPHFAVGTKDQDGSRIFYEPLAVWDPEGNLVPVLAAEVPSLQNGAVARDGRSVTWKLKKNVQWHDGKPFTADDVVFNWEYAADPASACTTSGTYKEIKVDKVDGHTVKITFPKPTPFWADPFVGVRGMIIPKHLFEGVKGELNPTYHMPNRPHFDTIEMKGGGDANSAARAVIQTGEYDFAWNLQVEDENLKRMEQGGRGKADITPGGNIEHVQLNNTDPWKDVDGERSSLKTKHPFLTDPAVRQALNLLVD